MAADCRMDFGKYKGEPISEIVKKDKGYATWFMDNVKDESGRKAKLRETFIYHFNKLYPKAEKIDDGMGLSDGMGSLSFSTIPGKGSMEMENKLKLLQNIKVEELPPMDEYQQVSLQYFGEGHSVFITGPAGTGKSVTVKHIVRQYPDVVILAPTWLAAANVGGQSIHRVFRIAPDVINEIVMLDDDIDPLWLQEFFKKRSFSIKRSFASEEKNDTDTVKGTGTGGPRMKWKPIKGLIIDEISMVHGKIFLLMDHILRKEFKVYDLPFGGMPVALVGDMAQLPPIDKHMDPCRYLFFTKTWKQLFGLPSYMKAPCSAIAPSVIDTEPKEIILGAVPGKEELGSARGKIIHLNIPHRQDGSDYFFQALSMIRLGSSYDYFIPRIIPYEHMQYFFDDVEEKYSWLLPRNKECDQINSRYLNRLSGELLRFISIDKLVKDSSIAENNDPNREDHFTLPLILEAKVGARLIVIKSLFPRETFYNGRKLKILGIDYNTKGSFVDKIAAESLVGFSNMEIEADHSKDLFLKEACLFNNKVLQQLAETMTLDEYPILKCCLLEDPTNIIDIHPYLDCKFEKRKITELRIMYPVRLGYAITIHRSQGLTLTNTIVGTDVFESGQLYTALTRMKKIEDVYILGSLPKFNNISNEVKDFLIWLEREHGNTGHNVSVV